MGPSAVTLHPRERANTFVYALVQIQMYYAGWELFLLRTYYSYNPKNPNMQP